MCEGQSVVMVARAGLPNCCVVIYLDAGPGGIFLGKPEKTAAQVQVCAIAGEAAATLGLFAKVERLGHRTHSQRGGSHLQGLSVAGAEGSLPAISGLYRFYVRYATQFPLRPEREGDSDRFRQALY